MKLEECVDELFNGGKLRRSAWKPHQYIHLNNGELLWWHDGLSASLSWFLQQGYTDWEFYDEACMDIPEAFWEMVDPKWNYLAMDEEGGWHMYDTCPSMGVESWVSTWFVVAELAVRLECFTLYKKQGDWTKTLYKRPGAE